MADLILQPALLSIPQGGGVTFKQFKDLPGEPSSWSGLHDVTRCEVCNEWSPQPEHSCHCRACGARGRHSKWIMLSSGEPGELQLVNGAGEYIKIPEDRRDRSTLVIYDPIDGPKPVSYVTIRALFARLLAGPPSEEPVPEKSAR